MAKKSFWVWVRELYERKNVSSKASNADDVSDIISFKLALIKLIEEELVHKTPQPSSIEIIVEGNDKQRIMSEVINDEEINSRFIINESNTPFRYNVELNVFEL